MKVYPDWYNGNTQEPNVVYPEWKYAGKETLLGDGWWTIYSEYVVYIVTKNPFIVEEVLIRKGTTGWDSLYKRPKKKRKSVEQIKEEIPLLLMEFIL